MLRALQQVIHAKGQIREIQREGLADENTEKIYLKLDEIERFMMGTGLKN